MKKTLSISKRTTANMMIIVHHLSVWKLAKTLWCWTATALTTILLCINSSIPSVSLMKIKDQTIKNTLRVSKQECIKIHQEVAHSWLKCFSKYKKLKLLLRNIWKRFIITKNVRWWCMIQFIISNYYFFFFYKKLIKSNCSIYVSNIFF